MSHALKTFTPLNCVVLTVSDTRNEETDTSGQYLVDALKEAKHNFIEKKIVTDDKYLLRAQVSAWVADPEVQVIITTGGTGLTGRDVMPESMKPLFDKEIEGFGELFRLVSFKEIGAATIQSRAFAGTAGKTLIFCFPGSTNACKTAWENILLSQLDSRTKPCNFVALFPRMMEK
jgi:molybdopterin adenylyltransferase